MSKVDEDRVRRIAERRALVLKKSRRRDPLAYDFNRFWLLEPSGKIYAGDKRTGLSLEEAESILLHPPAPVTRMKTVTTTAIAAKKSPQKKRKK